MMNEYDYLKDNIEQVRARVAGASARSGRNPEDVKIIAVTKTVDAVRILPVINEGIIELGENRVQELCDKYDKINESCNWHLIGHLQTNKVKYIIDKVSMIHSVDRIELADEIQKRAEKVSRVINTLVQVNVAEEESKFGLSADEAESFIRRLSTYRNIKVRGLMTIAPYTANPEEVRWVFKSLRKLLIDINKENIDNIDMDSLSMGMSNDFEIAIEEGANIVRIGTAIFGQRTKPV